MTKKILNLTDVAKHTGLSKSTLRRMIEDHRFPVRPIPRSNPRKWLIDDVNSWMAGDYV